MQRNKSEQHKLCKEYEIWHYKAETKNEVSITVQIEFRREAGAGICNAQGEGKMKSQNII